MAFDRRYMLAVRNIRTTAEGSGTLNPSEYPRATAQIISHMLAMKRYSQRRLQSLIQATPETRLIPTTPATISSMKNIRISLAGSS